MGSENLIDKLHSGKLDILYGGGSPPWLTTGLCRKAFKKNPDALMGSSSRDSDLIGLG